MGEALPQPDARGFRDRDPPGLRRRRLRRGLHSRTPGAGRPAARRDHEAGGREEVGRALSLERLLAMIFGKPYSEYVRYQMPFLIGTAVLGLVRLGLSLAGQPNDVTKFFSMSVFGFIGIFYYALT